MQGKHYFLALHAILLFTSVPEAFASDLPYPVKSLRSFGAVGNGIADDTAALREAVLQSEFCLDGEFLKYRVIGSITATNNICIVNAHITQDVKPIDTSVYIKSLARGEPILQASPKTDVNAYPEDPQLSDTEHNNLGKMLSLRTLEIKGARPIDVFLKNLSVNKGKYGYLGVGSSAAGIWIENAKSAVVESVDISGKGRGFGLGVYYSKNVRIDKLNVHDITWGPYSGDRPLIEAKVHHQFAWNNVPMYKYIGNVKKSDDRFRTNTAGNIVQKFAQVRSQEEITGLMIQSSDDVEVTNTTIARLGAIFDTGFIPWQADGIGVGHSNNVRMKNVEISHVWEGIDFVGGNANGGNIDGVTLDHIRMNDIHAFGLKFGYVMKNAVARDVVIRYAGYSGVVFNGPVSDVKLIDTHVREAGVVRFGNRTVENVWSSISERYLATGFRILGDIPRGIRIVDSTAYNIDYPRSLSHGFLNDAGRNSFLNNVGNTAAVGRPAYVITGFGEGTNYAYADAVALYQQINGCKGDPARMVQLWDLATYSSNSVPWTLDRLKVDLEDLKKRGIFYCAK